MVKHFSKAKFTYNSFFQIPREHLSTLLLVTIVISSSWAKADESKTYDTSEWIPLTNQCPTCQPQPKALEEPIEQQASDRVLNVANPETNRKHFFSNDQTPNSNQQQFLREVPQPQKRLPKRQPPLDSTSILPLRQQLNQGEIVNAQLFRQPTFQDYQNHDPQLVQQSPKDRHFFPGSPGIIQQQNFRNVPVIDGLNPGIQAINQGLSSHVLSAQNYRQGPRLQNGRPLNEKETVELVYVPIESLNQRGQIKSEEENAQEAEIIQQIRPPQFTENEAIHRRPQFQAVTFEDSLHKQQQLQSIQSDFAEQALGALKLQLQLQEDPVAPQTTQRTATVPPTTRRRRPHQPPLAVYMGADGDVSLSDVLNILKNSKTIAVQDSVGPATPQVFVGPHNLDAPEGYVKFDLPYLSSIENNRVERKVEQLPFFVAPLSYKAPPGYSKIPLPAPHVGSVVISNKEEASEKPQAQALVQPQQLNQRQPQQFPQHQVEELNQAQLIQRQEPQELSQIQQTQQQLRIENLFNQDPYRIPNQPSFVENTPRTIKPFKLENALNEDPYRIPNQFVGSSTPSSVTPRVNPLQQTINQYELEQINNQFLSQPQYNFQEVDPNSYEEVSSPRTQQHQRKHQRVFSTTPTPVAKTSPENIEITTRRAEFRSRQPSRTPNRNKYTVLEEFSIKDRPSTTKTHLNERPSRVESFQEQRQPQVETQFHQNVQPQPQSQLETRPQPELSISHPPQFEQALSLSRPSTQQPPAAVSHLVARPLPELAPPSFAQQEQPDYQKTNLNKPRTQSAAPTYYQLDGNGNFVPVESIDENSYRIMQQQTFEREMQNFKDLIGEVPSTVAPTARLNPIRSRTRPKPQPQPQPQIQEVLQEETTETNFKLPPELPSIHPGIHNLINDLQDQSVRTILMPSSIAPTTEHVAHIQHPQHYQEIQQEFLATTEEPSPIILTTAAPPETTTRRHRGRPRTRPSASTTTYSPRRTIARNRRPVSRVTTTTTTKAPEYTTEYTPRRSTTRPRSRTRPRPETSQLTERAFEEKHSHPQHAPQSYMQFEQIDTNQEQQQSSTEEIDGQKLSVDVLINHPIHETSTIKESIIISKPNQEAAYVRFNKNEEPTTRASQDRVRIRTRGRPKIRPSARPTSTTPLSTTEEQGEEFYGFFRQPNFNKPASAKVVTQSPKLYSSTYVSSTQSLQEEDQPIEDSNNVQIYSRSSTINTEYITAPPEEFLPITAEPVTTEKPIRPSPSPKIRSRTRVTSTKSEVTAKPTRNLRFKSRGTAHFKTQKHTKNASEDEDVEGGNYPIQFLKAQESRTERSKFQITVDPGVEEAQSEEDQEPFSSIHRPKYIKPEQDGGLIQNAIRGTTTEMSKTNDSELFEDEELEEFDGMSTTLRPKEHRRGVWRLVKRPLDPLETAESQYVNTLLSPNSFVLDDQEKSEVQPKEEEEAQQSTISTEEPGITTTTEGFEETTSTTDLTTSTDNFFGSLYKMFGIKEDLEEEKSNNEFVTDLEADESSSTTVTDLPITTTSSPNSTTTESSSEPTTTTASITNPQIEPLNLAIKTSTSTEISHETEICYRGKCVKSSGSRKSGAL